MLSRRHLLQNAAGWSACLSMGGAVPELLQRAAAASAATGNVLVVVQLSGGNDGLNTVIPHKHPVYRRERAKLAIPSADVLKLNDELGWHPAAAGLAKIWDAGQLAIVQGVGYPNPNRSHFESMDIWHTCRRKQESRPEGWLGRYLSNAEVTGTAALHLGGEKQPFALASRKVAVPTIQRLEQFRLETPRAEVLNSLKQGPPSASGNEDLLGFVQTTQQSALSVSEQLQRQLAQKQSSMVYPESGLAQKLKTVAGLIQSGLETCVYYVELDGFDTHSQQAPAHNGLLRQLGDGLQAFMTDLQQAGELDRVTVCCFSEFGRRVAENASEGTDHGTAAPVFIAGGKVRSGLIGKQPSLDDLDEGDLKFHTDFRQVYAAILEQWLKVPAAPILVGEFQPVSLFS